MFSPQYQEIAAAPQEQQLAYFTPYQQQQHYSPTITKQEPKVRVRPLWKFLAVLPPNLLLVGYLILPVAFKEPGPGSEPDSNVHINKAAIVIVASVLIAVAYVSSLVLVLAQSHNGSFAIQSVYIPCLCSSLLGLFNVVFNIVARNIFPLNSLEKVGMGLPSAFGLVYALAALWTYGKDTIYSTETQTQSVPEATVLLTEEEMQRRQLVALLEQGWKNGGKSPSPRDLQKTFKVDGPERLNVGNNEWDRYKAVVREG
ncbi:uncharacterized protein ASPGLDRAFT_42737 [Aspergillus glaucus CBS 516.65]|uniref:Uncharacterized protein n=1 Tax=Aspergillus glaucus CBS 516.65 TaxID=1160497 RepID=A0A1L9VUW4_ASPGL|nr:hypothetical protein ASPGLDRAFT_42737 [Aspergillus glaucus CBS 516.65]OJJ87690.1 hypothetical protein ASPGLDRAFT_42737 [Aspergillus glaucus CBS 516.65]